MSTSNFQSRVEAVARRIRADFEASVNTKHRGSRGTEREEIFGNFLSLYLPGTVQVIHNAEIITASKEVSPQCDVVIADKNTPRLQDLQSHHIVPVECVYGVIEIKSRLTGSELMDACNKIADIKGLPRLAYAEASTGNVPPIFGLIFGYDGIRPETLAKQFATWCHDSEPAVHPDSIWIWKKQSSITWARPGEDHQLLYRARATDDREVALVEPLDGMDLMIGLVTDLSAMITAASLPRLRLTDYLSPGLFYSVKRAWSSGAS
jgi:hypothetical protein